MSLRPCRTCPRHSKGVSQFIQFIADLARTQGKSRFEVKADFFADDTAPSLIKRFAEVEEVVSLVINGCPRQTPERLYHVPGGKFYGRTPISAHGGALVLHRARGAGGRLAALPSMTDTGGGRYRHQFLITFSEYRSSAPRWKTPQDPFRSKTPYVL